MNTCPKCGSADCTGKYFDGMDEAQCLRRQLAAVTAEAERSAAECLEWREKAKVWLASPEAVKRLDGYRELSARLEAVTAERDELQRKLASCSEADAVSYRDGVITNLQDMLDHQIALAEAASSQLRAAVDAYEKAEAKLEKVRLWAAEHLDDGCDCSIEYRSRKMVDPGCQWHDLEVERLDAILAPGGGEKE